ncbi:hypothetical protein [Clostridium felsineum]|uniref:hypothetical protein n=1 Tax=Clostridium felsineum TaxID=36839 RepID=UPI00098C699C|nr:hypothetical protein [Clostridium felsineum]URZ00897.1 hypothetical protein CLAUR_008850 [Clostridium felsineum]URZ16053.1 hypothetical protein CLFE_021000 [Clostridium felsineum DSM 794]
MSFKDKLIESSRDNFFRKYGDRFTNVQGNVLSVKVERKSILWIFNKLIATIIIKPDRSKTVLKCVYKTHKFFKKPTFMNIFQGNLVIVQGLKPKKNSKKPNEAFSVMNIRNLSTKSDLVKVDDGGVKTTKKVQRIK